MASPTCCRAGPHPPSSDDPTGTDWGRRSGKRASLVLRFRAGPAMARPTRSSHPTRIRGDNTMPTDRPMQLGMIGLGRMGANLVRRLMRDGHRGVAYDRSADAVKQLASEGAPGANSLEDFVPKQEQPRAIWIMV